MWKKKPDISNIEADLERGGAGQGLSPLRERLNFDIANISNLQKTKWLYEENRDALKGRISTIFASEVERGTGFNFLPVFLGIGITTYFHAPAEPSLLALLITGVVVWLGVARMRNFGTAYYVLVALLAVLAGMIFAQIAVFTTHKAMIERQMTARITGTVISVEQNRRGAPRYLIRPSAIEGLDTVEIPQKIRLSAIAAHEKVLPGETITGLARMQPVSGPVYPGRYNFAFFAWYEGLGGSGFFMGKPVRGAQLDAMPMSAKFSTLVNRFRHAIEKRIEKVLPGDSGKIAIALVTGNKSGIPQDIQQSLRVTGLAHILAISGLHMALVTLTMIWVIRAILARIPSIALRHPVKKIAVIGGFASSTFYLAISGGGVATQRAWIMISVMLLAALMDRRAITMRSVAISAIVILLLNPQSLFGPGFQMSFAAVVALVSGYELLTKRQRLIAENDIVITRQNRFFVRAKQLSAYFGGIAMTSLIAGTATGFIAAWHFNQIAPLGLIANILAMPVVTTIVMPFVLASLLLMPYGLEFIALAPVAFGIELVVSISQMVETFSPPVRIGIMPRASIALFALFLLILTIPKTRARLASFAILPIIAMTWNAPMVPDIAISENGRAIAVKTLSNELALLNTRSGSFVTDIWEKAWAPGGFVKLEPGPGKDQCNRERCIHVLPNSKTLHIVYNPDLLASSCQRADILVAPRLWWVNCRKRQPELVLKRHDFEQNGMHAIHFTGKKNTPYRLETGLKASGRPWDRKVPPVE